MGADETDTKIEMGNPTGSMAVSREEPGNFLGPHMTVFAVVSFYWVVSLALVFLNKAVMASDFPFPLFITWVQLVIALGCVYVLSRAKKSFPKLSFVPDFVIDYEIARKVLPLSLIYVAWISLTNVCLKFVEVSFYQLVKSLNIVMNIGLQWKLLGQPSSLNIIIACVVIMLGFVIGSWGEVHFSFAGMIAGVFSSMMQSFYGVFIKKKLPVVDDDTWKLLLYNTYISIFALFPMIVLTGELAGVMKSPELFSASAWSGLFMTGILGFLINIAIFMQIKVTSALTGTISGTAKACVQTFLGVAIFKNPISTANMMGLCLSLAGSGSYSIIRYFENQKK